MKLATPKVNELNHLLETKRQDAWSEIVLKYGKTFYYQGMLVTCDRQLVETLLTEKVHTEQRSSAYKAMGKIPGAEGLLFMDGAPWQKRTQALMPTLSKIHIDKFPGVIHQAAIDYAARWQEGEQLDDLFASLMEMGAAIALQVGAAINPEHSLAQPLAKQLIGYKSQTMGRCPMRRLDEFGLRPRKLLHLPWMIFDMFKLDRRTKQLRQTVQARLQEQSSGNDLNWFNRLQDAGFSLSEITNQINHLYGAFNAIDFAITSGFYELSRHPEWREILRSEFQAVLGDRAYPTRDDFPALKQTMNFMREVFRCYPVAMGAMRQTGKDIINPENHEIIPKNTEVMILIHALHHHPEYWQDPDRFDPDRWNAEILPHPPYAYIPFLEGPRQCIGRHWAELQFVVILNALLRYYDLDIFNTHAKMTQFIIPRFSENLVCKVHRIDHHPTL
jgi:cytochrome P450